jgi:acylphosphatase
MSNKNQVKVIVSGRVQGVFFRAHTKETANSLGLKGYVKNLANGDVEAVFEGEKSALTQMIAWCGKGPEAARVDTIRSEQTPTVSGFKTFEIKY